jgi:hypothetical protein
MAADQMDINLVILADTDTEAAPASPPMPEGVTCHVIPADLARDPVQLGMAMAFLIRGQVIISVGLDGNYLRAIPGLNPERTYRLRDSADGTVLQGLDVPTVRFDLGALPLDVPEGQHMPADATVLVILPKTAKRGLVTELEAEARRRGLQLLIAPGRGHGWQIIEKGDAARPLGRDVVWPPALRRCAMTACLGPVSELGAFDLALLTALQGCGVPAAVLPDAGKTRHSGMANQWIEARAVYEIQVNTPKWILDKLRKLISDAPGMEQLRDRSITVYRIASPPDLVRERLLHAVYRMVFAPPKREVLDAHT